MASLHLDERTGNWIVMFRWGGIQYRKSTETKSESEARNVEARVEEAIRLLKRGRLTIPQGADPGVWIFSDGKLTAKPVATAPSRFGEVCDAYYADQVDKADTTLVGESTHINHLKRLLGEDTVLGSLTLEVIQDYVNTRRKKSNRFGGKVSGKTIKKELTTFMQIWDWARQRGYVDCICPIKDQNHPRKWAVKIPKSEQSQKFMTWEEIERRIARGGLTAIAEKELWKFLYLDETQVVELLEHVKTTARHPFIYPMIAFAAYTGARRSEICRSVIDDFRFDEEVVVIREKKRQKAMAGTIREVPMRPLLKQIMQDWFKAHPGGQATIAAPLKMPRRKSRAATEALTREEAHHHFRETLANSKWKVVRGFHVLRHSFGAICTRAGIPPNVIAKWMGHTTDEMQRLYQHLFPQDEKSWMKKFPL
ncbi:MAG: tyrosine-type recombinase/integrase [Rhodopirellula sp.]|nr:tyrosine-type recombinase/integrase [Rhodopirellula sp.]